MQTFEFSSGPLSTKVELTDDGRLRMKQAFRWLEVPITAIVSAELKEPPIGDQVHLHIKCHPGTKPQKLVVFALGGEATFDAFVAAFKRVYPAMIDRVTPDVSNLMESRRYAIGGSVLFHSLPRWGVLLLWWCLAPAILPLFVAVYLSKRLRVVTDADGLTVLGYRTHRVPWAGLERIERVKIEQYVNGIRSTNLFRYAIGKVSFLMTGSDARRFEAELRARGVRF